MKNCVSICGLYYSLTVKLFACSVLSITCLPIYGQVVSLLDDPTARGTHLFEEELFEESVTYLAQLRADNQLLLDSNLTNYLYEVTDRLFPGQRAKTPWQVFVELDIQPGASAYPNGNLFITTGMLLRLNQEDQLAFILGHELAHYLKRHSLIQRLIYESNKSRSENAKQIRSAAFSRDFELEADEIALAAFESAGYRREQALEALKRLPAELNYGWILKQVLPLNTKKIEQLRSHPRTAERVERISELSADLSFAETVTVDDDRYGRMTEEVNLATRKIIIDQFNSLSNGSKANQIDSLLDRIPQDELDAPFVQQIKLVQADAWLNLLSLPPGAAGTELDNLRRIDNFRGQSNEDEEEVYQIFGYDKEYYAQEIQRITSRLEVRIVELRGIPAFQHEADRLQGVLLYQNEKPSEALPYLQKFMDSNFPKTQTRYVRYLIREINKTGKTRRRKRN